MEVPPSTNGPLEAALDAREKGIVASPCYPLTKVPKVKWKQWQTEMPPLAMQMDWFRDTRVNIAILTTSIVLFDIDDPNLVDEVLGHTGPSPHFLRSPRSGTHIGFRARKGVEMRNEVRIRGKAIDIRADGGIAMIPPSRTPDGRYEWLGPGLHRISDLPVARIGWTRERKRRQVRSVVAPSGDADVMGRRAWAWAACVEGAISGQRGHDKFFRFVCKMLHPAPRGFGLTVPQAMPIIEAFNEQCEPPFSDREIDHKVSDALKKA